MSSQRLDNARRPRSVGNSFATASRMLDNIAAYRRRSATRVAATIQTLSMITAELSELHKKLAAPRSVSESLGRKHRTQCSTPA